LASLSASCKDGGYITGIDYSPGSTVLARGGVVSVTNGVIHESWTAAVQNLTPMSLFVDFNLFCARVQSD